MPDNKIQHLRKTLAAMNIRGRKEITLTSEYLQEIINEYDYLSNKINELEENNTVNNQNNVGRTLHGGGFK